MVKYSYLNRLIKYGLDSEGDSLADVEKRLETLYEIEKRALDIYGKWLVIKESASDTTQFQIARMMLHEIDYILSGLDAEDV